MTTFQNGLRTPPRISDGFGWRIHPITGLRTFHYGADSTGHPNGRNYSVRPGRVIFASYDGGAGNAVHVRDAELPSIVFKYFHHAPNGFLVSVGQDIGEGPDAPVGVTGTTGASTGIHCHLQAEDNGTPFDPMPWLAARINPFTTAGGAITPLTDPIGEIDMDVRVVRLGGTDTRPQISFRALGSTGKSVEMTPEEWAAWSQWKKLEGFKAPGHLTPKQDDLLVALAKRVAPDAGVAGAVDVAGLVQSIIQGVLAGIPTAQVIADTTAAELADRLDGTNDGK